MDEIKISINGNEIKCRPDSTVFNVCKQQEIEIPSLCYHPELSITGACRLCLVDIEGKGITTSCTEFVREGMKVVTSTKDVINARKVILNLLLSDHPYDCMTCEKSGDCLLEKYAYEYGIKKSIYKDYHKYQKSQIQIKEKDGTPFVIRDYEKCILCGRCGKVCEEVVGAKALAVGYRGVNSQVISGLDGPLKNTDCVFCGNCIEVCPVGALREIQAEKKGRTWEFKKVYSVCPYCGAGCSTEVFVKDNKIVKISGMENGPSNRGWLCVKGKFAFDYVSSPDRLKKPLLKNKKSEFEEIEWDTALNIIFENFSELKKKYGPDSITGLGSARAPNEENYLFQKFFRQIIKTNNVDHCARLCHSATVAGLYHSLGTAGMSISLDELENISDCILVTGTNPTEAQPITSYRIEKAVRRGAKLIVIDPRRTKLADKADIYIQPKPGTDVILYNAIAKIILDENLHNEKFIKERVEGFEEYKKFMETFSLKEAERVTGVPTENLRKVALIYTSATSAAILWALGITEYVCGTHNVLTLANLALITGQIGKPGAGPAPLRGQNNVQGACDMGALYDFYPGYQRPDAPETIKKFESLWGETGLSMKTGLSVLESFGAAYEGKIKGMYIMGGDFLVTCPDTNYLAKALENLEFFVVQDIFLTETAQYADLILPAACSYEKEGTFTNTERRVQPAFKCVEPPGEAKADWEILTLLANKFGYKWDYKNVWDITKEINKCIPSYAGITPQRLFKGERLQWPCPDEKHPGTPTLHVGSFKIGKGKLSCLPYQEPYELPSPQYPYVLTTGRILSEYHLRSMTGRTDGIKEITGEPFCFINPKDAEKLKIEEGGHLEISTKRGKLVLSAKISPDIQENIVYLPLHFGANILTHRRIDPIAKIPEYKFCACNIKKSE
jgi:formate dehydrogenase alpha subunit